MSDWFVFFFSSRRRHTRLQGDWSSDVCSSDLRVPVENVKTLKTWLWVFSATDNLKNLKLHHIDYDPNMSLWDDFSQNRRPKIFSERLAIFTRRIPVESVKNLKTWLWVFSATDNLKNLKLHHIDYEPNMSLWDDFRQNRRQKSLVKK